MIPPRGIWAPQGKEPPALSSFPGALNADGELPAIVGSRKNLVKRYKRLIIAALPSLPANGTHQPIRNRAAPCRRALRALVAAQRMVSVSRLIERTSFRFFIIIKADRLPGPDKS